MRLGSFIGFTFTESLGEETRKGYGVRKGKGGTQCSQE